MHQKYLQATHVGWEKENGNYEANWGGKDNEANPVQFTPAGKFIEIEKEITVSGLPSNVVSYVKNHYHTNVTEAGKVTEANGKTSYEAEAGCRMRILDSGVFFLPPYVN